MNSISVVTLETSSTETGIKEFIAVGTTVSRGEDLAAKGSVSDWFYLGQVLALTPADIRL